MCGNVSFSIELQWLVLNTIFSVSFSAENMHSLMYPYIYYSIVVANSSNMCIDKMGALHKWFMKMFFQNAVNYTGKMFSTTLYTNILPVLNFINVIIRVYIPTLQKKIANYISIHYSMMRFSDDERLNLRRHRLVSSQKCLDTWNTLPIRLRNLSSMDSFKSNLKLHILN